MRKALILTAAMASVLALSSGAMAQSRVYGGDYGGDWMASAGPVGPGPLGGRVPFNLSNPYDAYDVSDSPVPFGGAHPWGSARNSEAQPYYNPGMDRAKGSIGGD